MPHLISSHPHYHSIDEYSKFTAMNFLRKEVNDESEVELTFAPITHNTYSLDQAWRTRQGSVCLHSLHSAVQGICAKKDNDQQIQSAGDHCRSIPHDRPGATEHRCGAQIQRRLHGMGMDRQLLIIPSVLRPVTRSSR